MDYYSYAPRVALDAPVFVCGLPGSEPALTARVATMLTGLPLVSIDRRVEHLASNAVELLEFREGREARLALESVVIDEAMRRPKPPVLASSSVTVLDARLVRMLEPATWLLLDMSVDEALVAMKAQVEADRRRHYAMRAGGAVDEDLRPELATLEALLSVATHRIAVRGRVPLEVGEELAEWLLSVGPVAS